MKKYLFIPFCFLLACCAEEQDVNPMKFNFSDQKEKGYTAVDAGTIYGNGSAYGYDLGSKPSDNTFFFSRDLDEGNYVVTVTLGSDEAESATTVKSESRRLMLENIQTAKGESSTHSFAVNIRNTKIGDTDSVRIKEREIGKLIWDNKLTLEFGGKNPSVRRLSIEKADSIPTVFLAGNSTVVDQTNEPWCGWGQIFPRFFKPTVAIANYAESGLAANSFVSSKRLAKLLTQAKPGDYLIIEFGHNDEKQKGEGKGPYTSFKTNLKFLADKAKEKGMIPILVTSMHRRRFDKDGKIIDTHGDYPIAARQLASEENIALIDLHQMSGILYEAWGDEESKKAFVHYPAGTFPNQDKPLADNTHFNTYGGYELAKCIVQGIKESDLELKNHILDSFTDFDPAKPDAMEDVHVPATPSFDIVKPDGN